MGARIGDLYASSGVSGVDPSSADKLEPVEGAASQAHFGLRNVRALAEAGFALPRPWREALAEYVPTVLASAA